MITYGVFLTVSFHLTQIEKSAPELRQEESISLATVTSRKTFI